jgi:MoaA/NifB/PqqE/SkfB family radical SAM enzyme
MKIGSGRILLSYVEGRLKRVNGGSDDWIRFLAAHPNVHRMLVLCAKSKPCERIVLDGCREAVLKYQTIDMESALRWLKDFRNYSENTKVNALNEMYEGSSKSKLLHWLSGIFNGLDPERKARILKRIFYNIILNGASRKIIQARLKGENGAVPNLSALMLATSSKCNLDCIGCESNTERNDGEATFEQLDYIIRQAKRLNVFHVVIIGKGEPLYDHSCTNKLLRLMRIHWDLNFILFTNGTTLEDRDIAELGGLDNLFTFVSIDGLEKMNDSRRGKGTYDKIMKTLQGMGNRGLFYGFSATVYRENYRQILSLEFLNKMMVMGCKAGMYLMFLPVHPSSNGRMELNPDEFLEYNALFNAVKNQISIPILDPESFEQEHGCRAKRGSLIYIDGTTGKVTPCVKSTYSPGDCNIYMNAHKNKLLEILKTDFFKKYRKSYTPCSQCSMFMEYKRQG